MRCWVLPDACLEILPVPQNSSSVYANPRSNNLGVGLYRPGHRPFRLHVAGLPPSELQARMERLGSFIKDPLFSQILRHLERDVVWANSTSDSWPKFPKASGSSSSSTMPPDEVPPGGEDELTMVWPYWEKGYGDVIANTLLPFGELLRNGAMPRHLALSGMRHATLLPPLKAATSTLCASERPNPPLLPRCSSTCWNRVRICAPEFFESTRDSWRSTLALDAAVRKSSETQDPSAVVAAAYAAARATDDDDGGNGASPSETAANANGGNGSGGSVLKVLIAARHGRRLLANAAELTAACNGLHIGEAGGTRLRCEMLPANAPQSVKIAALRKAHAYVCVWGGDTVHSLHMRRGSAVIELRPSGFAERAPWNWLELHRRWVTRFAGQAEARPLRFYPVLLPRNASVVGKSEAECFSRNTLRQQRWLKNNNATGTLTSRKKMPDETWLCYWNADLMVELHHILQPLNDVIRGAGGKKSKGRKAKGKKEK